MRITSEPLPQQQFCLQLNVSQCTVTETNSRFTATIYNPLSHHQTAYVRFPVNDDNNTAFIVLDPDGTDWIHLSIYIRPTPSSHARSRRMRGASILISLSLSLSLCVCWCVGSELVSQILPHRSLPDSSGDNGTTRRELVFQAARLPPLGHKTFYVVVNPLSTQQTPSSSSDQVATVTTITNEVVS